MFSDDLRVAMGMALDGLRIEPPTIDIAPPAWSEYLRIIDVPGLFGQAIGRVLGEIGVGALVVDVESEAVDWHA